MLKLLLSILLVGILVIAGIYCWHVWNPSTPSSSDEPESAYLGGRHEPTPGKSVAIVFIHGVFGSDSSWESGSGRKFLPEMLATDPSLASKADIFLFEFKTPKLQKSQSVPYIAQNLMEDLRSNQVWSAHTQVVFVAHSMGGIIARQELALDLNHAPQVAGMVFYAVPTDGAAISRLASQISRNTQLNDLLPLENNDYLQSLVFDWSNNNVLKNIRTACAFETEDTPPGIRVVDQSSATALCTERFPLNYDHIEIVKPLNVDDPRYTRMAERVNEMLGPAQANQAFSSVRFPRYQYTFSNNSSLVCKGEFTKVSDTAWQERPSKDTAPDCLANAVIFDYSEQQSGDSQYFIIKDESRQMYARLRKSNLGEFSSQQWRLITEPESAWKSSHTVVRLE